MKRQTDIWNCFERSLTHDYVRVEAAHLGSSSFITDAMGYVTQHLQYLPFGETFVDQQSGSFDSRYKFSAKEKDDETQYSYFGARYYDSDLSVWLSVDPMASEYPDQSPYSYVGNRPIMVIDPNGMNEWLPPTDGSNNWTAEAGDCAWTLHEDAGISFDQAKSSVGSMNAARGNGEGNLDVFVGDVVSVDKSSGYSWSSGTSNNADNTTSTPSNSSYIHNNDGINRDDISFGIGLETSIVSGAASGTKTGLISTIGKSANVVGGVWGAIDNSIAAADAFDKGYNVEGAYQTTQAAAYTVGTVMLFTPAAPIGAAIILVNGLVDIGEYFYKNW